MICDGFGVGAATCCDAVNSVDGGGVIDAGADTVGEGGDAVDVAPISTFVVSGTDMVMGGGGTGAADVMVIWAVDAVGGTSVICGRPCGVGLDVADGFSGADGLSPCSSSFFSSSVAISIFTRLTVCLVSAGVPIASLWCRCA